MNPNIDMKKTFFGDSPIPKQDSFLCCDGNNDNNNYRNDTVVEERNFLDETECVPYRNNYYQPSIIHNQYGSLPFISCDFSNGDFPFPRPLGNDKAPNNILNNGRYQCCRTGPAIQTIFVEDSAFKITLYLPIVFSCIVVVTSSIMFIGLLHPLLIQLKNGSFQRMSQRRSYRRSDTSNEQSVYSTYNLYLVYLAFFDFACYVFYITLFGLTVNQKFYPRFTTALVSPPPNVDSVPLGYIVLYAYTVANVWINSFIIYQVLVLLRASKNVRRVNRLSLTRVNLQAGAALLISIASGIGLYFNVIAVKKAQKNGDPAKYKTVFLALFVWSVLVIILPILYGAYAGVLIWWRGLIPSVNGSSVREKANREVALYFLRIIVVFFGIWIPGIIVGLYSTSSERLWGNILVHCLWSAQPVVTFCVVMTKSDARKYITDLLTLSYCFPKNKQKKSFSKLIRTSISSWKSSLTFNDDRNLKNLDESKKLYSLNRISTNDVSTQHTSKSTTNVIIDSHKASDVVNVDGDDLENNKKVTKSNMDDCSDQ